MKMNKSNDPPKSTGMTKNDLILKKKLDDTHKKGCEMTEESLRATNEMLRLILQCEHAGASTLATIHAQGEQLNNAESGLDNIHANLEKAGDDLTNIERGESRCCCCCTCCPTCRKSRPDDEIWKTGATDTVITKQPKSINGKKPKGRYINRITNDKAEDQMEKNMQDVSTHLGGLRNVALDINKSVSTQNTQIDRMNKKGESNIGRLDEETERTNKLLKK